MAGKFKWYKFSEIDINDSFFDTLKEDYSDFIEWFKKKSKDGEEALVYYDDENKLDAFLYLKNEKNESIEIIDNKSLPAINRLKIGTLRLSERCRGIRLGEGALGIALWQWQEKQMDEIYVTVFEKYDKLINLFQRFGFVLEGKKSNGESVYIKNRKNLDFSDPYKSFPFISNNFKITGVLPINDSFHDTLFPYSELKNNMKEIEEEIAGNGITKVYIATPFSETKYETYEPILIYIKYLGNDVPKKFKSAITSFCTITKVDIVKNNGIEKINIDDFIKDAGNKTVYKKKELSDIYNKSKNIVMIEMVYNGFFGIGKNINYDVLERNELSFNIHPYQMIYTKEQFIKILEMGEKDVKNIIIN